MTDHLPTGTVTFLFTDIEGSTPLWEREPKQMQVALARHHAILQESIVAHEGHVYKTIGDAFQAAFDVSSQALRAAVAAQHALAAESWPTSTPVRVRMGLHVGHAIVEGQDYVTTHTLNRVARIMSAAHGGQIVLSEPVAELTRDGLPEAVRLRDMGQHHMKGMTLPEHLFQVVAPGLPGHFPPLNTLDVFASNLPTSLTTFIGRESEVADVKRLLSERRLITLTGSGGCGKTRLAIHVGREIQSGYPHGVWLVELAPLTEPALVPQTVLSVLDLLEDGYRSPLEILTDFLRSKTLLLVLDNCEHLIRACAELSESLLRACPDLRILASSREALGVAGEAPYRVPSLAVPDPEHLPPLETLAGLDAVRLFAERAATARPGFALSKQNASAVAKICKRLDGIPLALELAAARVRMLSVEQIAVRLDDRFRLLTGGSRTALPRQQTLRAMIDWSYTLLSKPERLLFKRLAVFAGGWTVEAAELVCSGNGIEPYDVLDLLARLVDKSLVLTREVAGETRYGRLETIRQYSREKFFEIDEVESLRDRHLAYYVQFAERAEERGSGRGKDWTRRIEAEQDNLRTGLEWGLATDPDSALRIVGHLGFFWSAGGYSPEGVRWTQQALERVEALEAAGNPDSQDRSTAKAKALAGLALAYLTQGDNERARLIAEESVRRHRQGPHTDKSGQAFALTLLGEALYFLNQLTEAEAALQESLALARETDDTFVSVFAFSFLLRVRGGLFADLEEARSYAAEAIRLSRAAGFPFLTNSISFHLGLIAMLHDDAEEARRHFHEAIAAFQESGPRFNLTQTKSELAHLERNLGNYAVALEIYRETIVSFQEFGMRGAVAHQLECFAFIAIPQGQLERALRLLGAAEAAREQGHTPMTPHEQIEYQAQVEMVHTQVDSGLFAKTWAAGRAMAVQEAIQLATEAEPIMIA